MRCVHQEPYSSTKWQNNETDYYFDASDLLLPSPDSGFVSDELYVVQDQFQMGSRAIKPNLDETLQVLGKSSSKELTILNYVFLQKTYANFLVLKFKWIFQLKFVQAHELYQFRMTR